MAADLPSASSMASAMLSGVAKTRSAETGSTRMLSPPATTDRRDSSLGFFSTVASPPRAASSDRRRDPRFPAPPARVYSHRPHPLQSTHPIVGGHDGRGV